jgi:MFS family permease
MFEPILSLLSGPHRFDFLRATILCTLDMSAFWIAFSWLPTYFEEQRGMTIAGAAVVVSIAYIGILIGQLCFGYLADWIGRRASFTAFSFTMAGGLLAITLFWSETGGSNSTIHWAMFVTGFGAGMFGGYGPLFTELFPTGVRNTAMGGAYNLARGTQFLTPLAVALIAEKYGLSGGISLASFFAVASGLFVWVFPPSSNRIATEIE